MESFSSSCMTFLLTQGGLEAVVAVLVLTFLLQRWFAKGRAGHDHDDAQLLFPKGPPAWPIIGHLPLLFKSPHRVLRDFCVNQGYGPIMGLHLGSQSTVVVSNAAFAKELLLTQDKIFANRPPYEFANSLFYGYDTAVVMSSYTPHWTRFRKIYTLELLSAKRLRQLQHIRQEEMCELMRRLHEASRGGTEVVDVGKHLGDLTSNTTARLLHSKTLTEVAPELPKLVRAFERLAFPTLGDFFPSCKFFLDFFHKRSFKSLHNRMDKIIDFMIEERKQLMKTLPPHELPHDFLQVVLSKEASNGNGNEDLITKIEIKSIILDILLAGIHTSSSSLEWAMTELLRHPDCLKKLQEEIDRVMGVGGDNFVNDEDIAKLPYLENTIKEVFRIHPALPLLIPRISSQACKVGKYTIPKNTQALVNVWAIGQDPQVWDKPDVFCPERFQGKDMDMRGQHFELLPFGAGRRVCPGISLGLSIVHVTLANLIKNFDWVLPHGQTPSSIDISEKGSIGNAKALPMLVIPKARCHYYNISKKINPC